MIGLFSAIRREFAHAAVSILVAVLLAVASELVGIRSFEEVSLVGLAVAGTRAFAISLVALLTSYASRYDLQVPGGRS